MFRPAILSAVWLLAFDASCVANTIAPPTNFEQALGTALTQPVVVYARDEVTPCFADYVPTPAEASGQLHVDMASNEYEPLQVGLYVPRNADPVTRVRIELDIDIPYEIAYLFYDDTGWPGSGKKTKWRPADTGKWYKRYPGGRTAMPLYVIAGDTIDRIAPGATAAFWITFRTDDGTPSGTHRGSIKVMAQGVDVVEQPLTVHVRSFALPRPDIVFGLYYRPDRIPVYWQPRYQQLYINDMAAHGMTSCQIVSFYPSFGTDDYRHKGRVEPPTTGNMFLDPWRTLLDPSEYADGLIDPGRMVEEQMKMLRSAGLLQGDMPVWTVQENVMFAQKPVATRTMRRFSFEHDWPEIILQTRDEPPPWSTGPGQISPEMARAMLDFKKLKDCRTFTALSMAPAFAWGHLHDVWIVLGGEITPEMIREAHRQGSQVWTYSERLRYTNALINRYYAGIYTWALGLEGNTPYAYHHYLIQPPLGQPAEQPVWLADRRRPSHDNIHAYVLPGPDGPIPGIGWEGRREGVDDYRHLQLLETRIAAAGESNRVAVKAAQWLKELRKRIEMASVQGIFGAGTVYLWELDWVDPAPDLGAPAYPVIRKTAAGYIDRLPAAAGERNPMPSRVAFPQVGWEGEPFDEADLATCVAAIRSGSVRERRAAVAALTVKFADGMDATEDAVKAIMSALDDPQVRVPALRAIRYLGAAAASAAKAVHRQLQAEDPFIRCGALLALGAMAHHGVDGLVAGLEDPFAYNASLAARCLRRVGPDATTALEALETALVATSNPSVRSSIAAAIQAIRGTE